MKIHSTAIPVSLLSAALLISAIGCSEDVEPIKNALGAMTTENAELKAAVVQTTNEKAGLLKQRDEKSKLLETATSDLESAKKEIESLQDKEVTLSNKLAKASKSLEIAETKIEELTSGLTKSKAKEKSLAEELVALEESKSEIADSLKSITNDREALRADVKTMNTKLAREVDNAAKLKESISELTELKQSMAATLEQREQEVKKLDDSLKELQNQREQEAKKMSASLKETQDQREAYAKQLEATEKKLAEASVNLKVARSEVQQQDKHIEDLEKQIQALNAEAADQVLKLNSELNVSENAGDQWLSTIKRLQADRLEKRKEISVHDELVVATIERVSREVVDSINRQVKIHETLQVENEGDPMDALRKRMIDSAERLKEMQTMLETLQKKQAQEDGTESDTSGSPSDAQGAGGK